MLEPSAPLRNAMGNALRFSLLSLSLLIAVDAWGQVPSLANCTRSANLLACVDADGNAYSVNTVGSTIYLRGFEVAGNCLLYTSPSPRDLSTSRMPSSA